MKYFLVTCVRGHQGIGRNDSTITFKFQAPNAVTAMHLGQSMPGVKHNKTPLSVREISEQDYLEITESAYAPFQK